MDYAEEIKKELIQIAGKNLLSANSKPMEKMVLALNYLVGQLNHIDIGGEDETEVMENIEYRQAVLKGTFELLTNGR